MNEVLAGLTAGGVLLQPCSADKELLLLLFFFLQVPLLDALLGAAHLLMFALQWPEHEQRRSVTEALLKLVGAASQMLQVCNDTHVHLFFSSMAAAG